MPNINCIYLLKKKSLSHREGHFRERSFSAITRIVIKMQLWWGKKADRGGAILNGKNMSEKSSNRVNEAMYGNTNMFLPLCSS